MLVCVLIYKNPNDQVKYKENRENSVCQIKLFNALLAPPFEEGSSHGVVEGAGEADNYAEDFPQLIESAVGRYGELVVDVLNGEMENERLS